MPGMLSERIAALRKERGLTQEQLGKMVGVSSQAVGKWEKGGAPDVELLPVLSRQLGVTIDALFGLDGGEQVDVEDTVRRWIVTVPKGQRMDQLCELIWAIASAVIADTLNEATSFPLGKRDRYCEGRVEENGKTRRWLRRIRFTAEEGLILGLRSESMTCASIFPEPGAGWEAFLDSNARYRRLFGILAKPHCMELLEYLDSKPARSTRRYTPDAIASAIGIETVEVEELTRALAEIGVLLETELEAKDGVCGCYFFRNIEALYPFLYFARWLMTFADFYINCDIRTAPILRGEKWKETGGEED